MKRLVKSKKVYKILGHLNTNKDEPVVLLKVGPITTEDHQPTQQPKAPVPQRHLIREIAQRFRAHLNRLVRRFHANIRNEIAVGENDTPFYSTVELTRWTPIISGTNKTLLETREDQRTQANSNISVRSELSSFQNDIPNHPFSHGNFSGDVEYKKALATPSQTTYHETTTSPLSGKAKRDPACVLTMDSFNFHKVLGQGAFGKVLLASHPAIDQQLAVKFVKKKKLVHDPDSALTECQVLKLCKNSKYITHLYSTFQTPTYLIYVMELLCGDLLDLLMITGALDLPVIRCLTAEIICGLQFLHSAGIIHRDLKPDNILLDSEGHVRIADFGLSAMNITESMKIRDKVGTHAYMAPEVFLWELYCATADYYSLGLIIYMMAFDKFPFYNGQTDSELELTILTTAPFYPKDMDTDLHDLMERLLCIDQDMRGELVRDIRELPIFKTIDWAEVEEGTSPSPFESAPTLLTIPDKRLHERIEVAEFISCQDPQPYFRKFSYRSESMRLQPRADETYPDISGTTS